MPVNDLMVDIDPGRVAEDVRNAIERVNEAGGDSILDFSSVRRIDTAALNALEQLARTAEDRGLRITLSGVNVSVYRVLKLMKITSKFSFVH